MIKAALEEPHNEDIVLLVDGVGIAVHKTLGSENAVITVSYTESGFKAELGV